MSQQKVDLNQILQEYAEQSIDKLDISIKNVNKRDHEIIYKLNDVNTIMDDLKLKNLMKKFVNFYNNIRNHSNKPETMNTHISGGPDENHLILDINFDYKKYQLNSISYPFLLKPNSFFLKMNYTWLNNWFKEKNSEGILNVKECNFGGGIEYNYNKSKQSIFVNNTIFFPEDYELDTFYKRSYANLDTKRKQSTSLIKLALHKNFDQRPFIFRDKPEFDPINRISFEFGNKTIHNIIDENNCSSELHYQTPAQDSMFFLRVLYEKNNINFSNFDIFNLKASSGIYKSLNSIFIKNKLFLRKLFFVNDFVTYQMNFELGNILNMNKSNKELKIHETFLKNNFKGVTNPSPKVVVSEGKSGDALGYKNYIQLSNKIFLTNVPVFNNFMINRDGFQISPFFHLNFMLLPDNPIMTIIKKTTTETSEGNTQIDNTTNDAPYYISAGFGVNFISEAISGEFYYNAYIKKNVSDIGSEFSFNFGCD